MLQFADPLARSNLHLPPLSPCTACALFQFHLALQEPGQELLVDLDERCTGRPTSGAAVAAQWFAQPIFGDADLEDEEDEEQPRLSSSGRQQPQPKPKGTVSAKTKIMPISKAERVTQTAAGASAAAVPGHGPPREAAATAAAQAADNDNDQGSASSSSCDDASQDMQDDDDDDVAQARIDSGAAAAPSGNKSGFEEVYNIHSFTLRSTVLSSAVERTPIVPGLNDSIGLCHHAAAAKTAGDYPCCISVIYCCGPRC